MMNQNTDQRTRISIVTTVIIIVAVIALVVAYNYKKPATDTSTDTTEIPVSTVSYSCSAGKTITASYYKGTDTPGTSTTPPIPGGSVALTLSDGRTMTLKQSISADGTRYANADESFVFWSKGNGALVLEHNEEKSYIGCIKLADVSKNSSLGIAYANSEQGFSIRLPGTAESSVLDRYTIDSTARYQALGPGKDIFGTRFTIPDSIAKGSNLSTDTYISVEQIPKLATCSAKPFLMEGASITTLTEMGTTYSVGTSSDAGAGNRYEETVYALPGTSPCIAIRYFIHYGVFENYPTGTKQFDKRVLVNQFDAIRRTLTIVQ